MALDLVRAAVALCLPLVTEIWQVYVLIFLLQSASAAFTPTFQATIPDVLPDDARYTRALVNEAATIFWRAVRPTAASAGRASGFVSGSASSEPRWPWHYLAVIMHTKLQR